MSERGWSAYAPLTDGAYSGDGAFASRLDLTFGDDGPDPRRKPEFADLGRLARRGVEAAVRAARVAEQPTVGALLVDHLGEAAQQAEVARERWAQYEAVNMQRAVEAWLAAPGRSHRVLGVATGGPDLGLAELIAGSNPYGIPEPRPVSVARTNLACGPGQVQACVQSAVYLASEEGGRRVALFSRLAAPQHGVSHSSVEIVSNDPEAGAQISAELRELSSRLNCYRGQVLSLGQDPFTYSEGMFTFHERPTMTRAELILEDGVLADIEQQVVGVSRHRAALLRAGQHLKRGVLLYGPPGVGKTHTVRYLSATLPDTTVLMIGGEALGLIGTACSVARSLQPALVVIEDVDLIAEDRGEHPGRHPLLFELLNAMDGLDGDAEVCFLLTTNRADLLEPALAARPGRVDQAIEIELPGLRARQRLFDLYARQLEIRSDHDWVQGALIRAESVTASFLKEWLRRSTLVAADRTADDRTPENGDEASAHLYITTADLDTALTDLLSTRNRLTRRLLGAGEAQEDEAR